MNTMRILKTKLLLSICLTVLTGGVARADLIVEIRDTVMAARTSNSIDVYLYSRDNSPIEIAGFDFTFVIADVSPIDTPASGELYFLDSFDPARPLDAQRQSNQEQTLPDYVFRNQTSVDNFAAFRLDPTITQIAIGDSTFNVDTFEYTNIPVTTPRLLARLELGQRQSIDTVLERGHYEVRFMSGMIYNAELALLSFSVAGPGSIMVSAIPEPSFIGLAILLPLALRRMVKYRLRAQ